MGKTVDKESIRNHLRRNHTDAELKTWFDPLNIVCSGSEALEVHFPHALFSRWFDRERRKTFERDLHRALGSYPRIVYAKPDKSVSRKALSLRAPGQRIRVKNRSLPENPGGQWSFMTFIHNKKNEFAVSVARELAMQPQKPSHVPLILTGKGTCGKTHLLRAMAREISACLPEGSVFLGTAAELNAYFLECADSATFKRKILRKKAVFIDNANKLSDYPALQQELIFLTDTFKDKNKPLVLAVDANLDYETIDRQLGSRLAGGLVLTLKGPDLDVRLRYARAQCAAMRVQLKRDSLLPIAQRFRNFRAIQGVIANIAAYEKKSGRPVSSAELQKILAGSDALFGVEATPGAVISLIAEACGISPEEITGNFRRAEIVKARQIAMYLCRELLEISLSSLGKYFNGKNHATVLYACKKIDKMLYNDKDMHNLVTRVRKKFLSLSNV